MKRRLLVLQRLDLEVRDGDTAHVGHRHTQHEAVHEVADHDVLPELRLRLAVPRVGVQRMVVHRDHAEQVVIGLGDGLAGPVLVDVADLEVLEVATERTLVNCHRSERTDQSCRSAHSDTETRERRHRERRHATDNRHEP